MDENAHYSKGHHFSMPPEMAEQVQQILKEEGHSMSEFLGEAIRLCIEERKWLRQELR